VRRYVGERVPPEPPAQRIDAFVSPEYGWIIERPVAAMRPDTEAGEAPELPYIQRDRPCRTADISAWTSKKIREVVHSHVNAVVAG
jgi:type III restriction enzyme